MLPSLSLQFGCDGDSSVTPNTCLFTDPRKPVSQQMPEELQNLMAMSVQNLAKGTFSRVVNAVISEIPEKSEKKQNILQIVNKERIRWFI